MKIVIVSDSHGNREVLDKIVRENPTVSIFLHAGDSGLSRYEIAPFLSVKGNCDFETAFVDEYRIKTPYGNLYYTHGHRIHTLTKEKLDKLDAKIFVFGHTHVKMVQKLDDCYVFNPVSATRPRDGRIGSYLVLEITEENVKYEFKYLN